MRALVLITAAPLLAACSESTPAPLTPPAPTAAATATAAPTAAQTAAPAPEPDLPSPYFVKVIHGQREFAYHPLKTGGVVIDGGYLNTPVYVDQKSARVAPELHAGLKGNEGSNAFMINSVGGDWPRSGRISINLPGDRGGTDVSYDWNGSTWVKSPAAGGRDDMPEDVARTYYTGGFQGMASWGGRSYYYMFGVTGAEHADFVPTGKNRKVPTPIITKGTGGCSAKVLGYMDLTTWKSGELVGIGKLCTGEKDSGWQVQYGTGDLVIERWPKGSTTSVIEVFPGTGSKGNLGAGNVATIEVSDTDRYVRASFYPPDQAPNPYLAHYDGKGWTEVTPPVRQSFHEVWVEKDGSLWAQMDSDLYRLKNGSWEKLTPGGAQGEFHWIRKAPDGTSWALVGDDLWHLGAQETWEKSILPKGSDGKRLVADRLLWHDGEMLIVARGATESALLGTVQPEKVLDLAAETETYHIKAEAHAAWKQAKPFTRGCKDGFVVLYKLSRVAPPDYDFPLTRDALKGHTELSDVRFAEGEDLGTRYLVAFVPSPAKGQKLIKLVEAKVQNARPQMLCGSPPKINRELKFDLRTGVLVK